MHVCSVCAHNLSMQVGAMGCMALHSCLDTSPAPQESCGFIYLIDR